MCLQLCYCNNKSNLFNLFDISIYYYEFPYILHLLVENLSNYTASFELI